jgi:hypothetical protein
MAKGFSAAIFMVGLSLAFSSMPSFAQEFTVCEAQYIDDCHHQVDTHTPCGTIADTAESLCLAAGRNGQYNLIKLDDIEGSGCGAAIFRVTCL